MRRRKGDTLVEVALAIGIFSMVAITVVSVISASTSAAQSALETTLTREDIDSQAEALRFIHDSYVNGIQSAAGTDNPYKNLWGVITNLAYEYSDADSAKIVLEYRPKTCSDLYNNGWVKSLDSTGNNATKAPFIVNIRKLSGQNPDDIIISEQNSTPSSLGPFSEAETYPRILYRSTDESFYSQTQLGNDEIARVEGLFVVAVKGEDVNITTGNNVSKGAAYYDFYIRSCWMPPNSDRASTISTLVRLYDPAIMH